jgi:transposase
MKHLEVKLNAEDKDLIEKLLAAGQLKHKYAVRLQTILLRARNKRSEEIADFLRIHPSTVSLHINRYNTLGIEAMLCDKTRKPGTKPISQEIKNKVYQLACNYLPEGGTHWSCRTLAEQVGISHTAVNTILKEHGLQPHKSLVRNYSNDPDFESKLTDVVGLYLKPPKNAIVLCVDEKSQIQALDRTQPILPMIRNVPERQSFDYIRHGTTTLFAALDYLSGNVIGECSERHTSEDFIRFLNKLDKVCDKDKVLHIVMDNLSTHKTKAVMEYLATCPKRFVIHFIPTHSSWLNLVERWFAEITNKRIRRGSFESVPELIKAIKDFIKTWNKSGKSFTWTKRPDEIIGKINKAKSYC